MKIKINDYLTVNSLVQNKLNEAAEIFGVSFKIEEILLYGSQVTEKIDPNDIDVFVKVNSIKITNQDQFLKAYGPTPNKLKQEDLMEIIYTYLHDEAPFFNGTCIDINFRDYDLDLDGNSISLT